MKTNKEKLLFAVLALTALTLPTVTYAACYAYDSTDPIPPENSCSESPCTRAEWYPSSLPVCKESGGYPAVWTGKSCGYSGTFQRTKKWYTNGTCTSGACFYGSFQQSLPYTFDKPVAEVDETCTLE
jgi:hypothetical protein